MFSEMKQRVERVSSVEPEALFGLVAAPRAGQGRAVAPTAARITRLEAVLWGLGGLRRQSQASSSGPVSQLGWDGWQLLQIFLSCAFKVGLSVFGTVTYVIIASSHRRNFVSVH